MTAPDRSYVDREPELTAKEITSARNLGSIRAHEHGLTLKDLLGLKRDDRAVQVRHAVGRSAVGGGK